MYPRLIAPIALAVITATFSLPGQAALVQLCGPTVCYEYDNDGAVNPGVALFGAPTLLGNSNVLKFTPTTLNVYTSGVAGAEEASWSFQFSRVWSPQGHPIGPVNLVVAGDYQIPVAGTVRADFALRAEGGPSGFPEVVHWAGSFSDADATGLPFKNWDLTGSINPADALADLASQVSLTISGRLLVTAGGAEDSAFMAQKVGLLAGATVVPAPGGAWLMTTALAALLHRARRQVHRARRQARR